MKVVVGLGNPGIEYHASRHNAGFMVISELACQLGAHLSTKKDLFCDLVKTTCAGSAVMLVKPMTFMNLSGKAVQAVLSWYKLDPACLLVVHDDVSLPLGKLRLQKNGGAGGQHGIESIIECLGGKKEFCRLKVGVGPDPGGARRADYVLSPVPLADRELYHRCLQTSVKAVESWINRGIEESMNQFNGLELNPRAALVKDEPAAAEGDR